MEATPNPIRLSLSWTYLTLFSFLLFPSILSSQCDTEVSGILTYCNAIGTPGTTGYFVGFRVTDPTGDTLNVVDLNGNNITNRGKRIDDINSQNEPATVTVVPLRISGVGADTIEYWYFGPYANGSTFNIALIDPNNVCDTVFVATGTYNCMDNTGTSDPAACDSDVPLYFLDFSQTEFLVGGGGGGNESFDEVFVVMSRSRESVCCDVQPANQSCFEFVIRLNDEDIGLTVDDVGSGSPGGEIYADTINAFMCTGNTATTWPLTQSGGQSQDLPLCLQFGEARDFVVLSCKSGGNVTGVSIDAISGIVVTAPPVITIEPCNVFLQAFNADTVTWSSPDDPGLDNLQNCTPDGTSCEFLYDVALYGEVTVCAGDTFVYIASTMPPTNACFPSDTTISDTTYVVVYPVFEVDIVASCTPEGDSLILNANVTSAAPNCVYAYDWSTGDTTQMITVAYDGTEYFVTVTRGDLPEGLQACGNAVDSIVALGEPMLVCDNITDTLYACINQLPQSDTSLVTITGCVDPNVLIYSEDSSNGGAGCVGDTLVITRLYIVDFDGDTTTSDLDTCVQNFSFVDNIAPVITSGCPPNDTVQCANQVPAPTPELLTAADNCGAATPIIFGGDVITNQTCANRFTVIRTYTATDACGNTGTCAQTITVFDNTAPVITCPANVSVECASLVPAPNTSAVVATDNCGGTATVTFTGDVISNQTCANRFTVTRTYSATDGCGNTATCTQTITVFDDTVPVITCPNNVTVQCANLVPAPNTSLVVASDNCGGTTTVTFVGDVISNQTCANRFTVTRTYNATDACGNSATCAQIITVFDNTAPIITCPANVTVQCASLVPVANPAAVVASDNCGGTTTVTAASDVISNQTCINRFTITRVYTATDACGNSATCAQIITVFDNTAPIVTCPAGVTVQCASQVPTANPAAVMASDNCGGMVTVVFAGDVVSNQTCANRFTVTRTYLATDNCSNTATCTQTITVFDNTAPSITCPANVTVQCASLVPAPNSTLVTVTDNCGGSAIATFAGDVISNQTCANRFTVTRTYSATDACGNTGTCTQIITVFDNTAPLITCPANVTVQCASLVPAPNTTSVIATDNCGGTTTVLFTGDVVSNQTCANRFTVTRTYSATDACGNTATCAQIITVFDNTPPVIACPANVTLDCTNGTSPEITGTATATDNCSGTPVMDFVDAPVMGACPATFTRTWIATDECGNSATCAQFITIADTLAPVITCPDDVTIECFESTSPDSTGIATATDICDANPTVVPSDAIIEGACPQDYAIYRTWTATDDCGNTSTCLQVIIVIDTLAPEIICPANVTVSCANEVPFADPTTVTASDSCGLAIVGLLSNDTTNMTCANRFTITRTYSAADECGNSASCSQTITVFDSTPPMITCPDDVTINSSSDTSPETTGVPTASDNCGGAPTVGSSDTTVEGACLNDYTIQRTFIATDACGNSATCLQTISVTGACNVDLSLTKVINPSQGAVSGGDNVSFTFTITNEGGLEIGSVTIIDYIPDGFILNDPDWTAGVQGSTGQSASIVLSIANGLIPPGGLAAGESVTVEITLQAAPDITSGVYINAGEITAATDTNGNDITANDVDSNADSDDTNDAPAEDDFDPELICVLASPVIVGDTFACTGQIETYSILNYDTANTYVFTLSGGGMIIGSTDSTITVQWTAAPGGPFQISVTETAAIDCFASDTIDVFLQGGDAIACIDHINLSIDNECGTVVTSGLILTGEMAGDDNYAVYVIDMNGDTVPNATFTFEHVGQTFKVSVVSECSGQSCWGFVTVEDKMPPLIDCVCPVEGEGEGCTITCLEIDDFLNGEIPQNLRPTVLDNCGGGTLEITDIALNFETCAGGFVQVTWLATDIVGNSTTCVQVFPIEPLTLDSLVFPADFVGECTLSSDPSVTGWPTVDGLDLTNIPSFCNIIATYSDLEIPLCGGGRKIIRTFSVFDWCVPERREFVQLITLMDRTGPVLTCPADMTVGTDVWFCSANIVIPMPAAFDSCSDIARFQLFYEEGVVIPVGNTFRITDLSLGTHTMTWIVSDECGNTSSCTFDITVVDDVPPVMSCQQHLVVSLTNDRPNGITLIPAAVFNDLSEDNCSPVTFRARRMESCIDFDWTTNGACVDDIPGGVPAVNTRDRGASLGICVPFACCDIGAGPIMVELEGTDAAGNVNYCMVEVVVQDKLAPVVICPPDITLSCEFDFDVIEGVFSDINGNNDGSLDEDPLSDLFGNVLDAFRFDESDRSDIIINDPTNVNIPQPFNFGIDGWANDNCGVNLSVVVTSYEDCSGEGLPGNPPVGATRLITRRFHAVDPSGNTGGTCTQRIWVIDFEPFFITDETCFNENPNDGVIWPCDVTLFACPEDLTGTGEPVIFNDACSVIGVTFEDNRFDFADGSCYKIVREWSIIDWCTFDIETGAGLYSYSQVIKVMDSAGSEFLDCSAAPVELCLDNPGISLPANNQVFLGENNPNATSCSVHVSMSRTVQELCSESITYSVLLYPFNGSDFIVLKPSTVLLLDANHQGVLTFNTQENAIPSISQNGLPYNTPACGNNHRIVWLVADGCGNESSCDQLVRLEDCKDPSPVCLNGISTVIMQQGGFVTIWASDFNASSFDDCTPSEALLYSFSGTSYEPSFTYTCDNVPAFGVPIEEEIWVADAGVDQNCNGIIEWSERNKDFCVTFIIITDNDNVCDEEGAVLEGEIMTEHTDAVSDVNVRLTGPNGTLPVYRTTSDGKFNFANVPAGMNYTIKAERNDNHKNGVSTLDLVRIQKHLLGKEVFTSPYQYIAADANNSETVSAIDLVEIRKLILGVYQTFPANQSWRFVKEENPPVTGYPWPLMEEIQIDNLSTQQINELNFVGIKIGDVNNSVKANALQILPRNTPRTIKVNAVADGELKTGEVVEIKFVFPEIVSGFQWTLATHGLQYEGIMSKDVPMDEANVGIFDNGMLTMSWNGDMSLYQKDEISFVLSFVVTAPGDLEGMLAVSNAVTHTEAYTLNGDIVNIELSADQTLPFTDFALYQNQPNPWNGETVIGFDLPEAAEATLIVYDVTGKTLKSVTGNYREGYNVIRLFDRDLPAAGVYYYRLESGGYSASKKMMVIR